VVTSFRVSEDLWTKAKIYAIENKMTMKGLIETLLKIELKEKRIKELKGNE